MAVLKTQVTKASVPDFIAAIGEEEKRKDAKTLVKLFKEVTGEKPALWNNSAIGFGTFSYKSERSKQAGDWFMTGFAPRKAALTVYMMAGMKKHAGLLEKLGKFTVSGGSCIYIKRLSDVDLEVLKELVKASFAEMKAKYK